VERDETEFVLKSGDRRFILSFNSSGPQKKKDELTATRLFVDDGKKTVLAITRSGDSHHLQSNISVGVSDAMTSTFACPNKCETELLIKELEILYHDRTYEGAAFLAAELIQT
jgi:hypothetical protein